MNSLQNLVSRRSSVSTNSSSKGKLQSQTKAQDLITMTANVATLSQCIVLILMDVGHQRIGRRTLQYLRKKETREPSIKDSPSIVKEVAHQVTIVVMTEAHTKFGLHTTCFMTMKSIISQKIAPYSLSLKEKWSKTPISRSNN
jgi:hypothetical protein